MKSAKTARRLAAAVFGLGTALAASAQTASAGTTRCTIESDMATSSRKLATFDGTASYDSDSHKLSITLRNTSKRGVLTGFAFKTAGPGVRYVDGDLAATTRVDEDKFDDLLRRGKTTRKVRPFGAYGSGALLNGQWTARPGRPHGVREGQSRTFVFDVDAPDAASMSIMDVMGGYGSSLPLVTAFKDVRHWKSDRVAAKLTLVPPASPIGVPIDLVVSPGTGLEGSPGTGTGGTDTDHGSVGPGPVTGGGNTGGGGNVPGGEIPAAVPLPPAAFMGLAMMGLMGLAKLRRRCFGHAA